MTDPTAAPRSAGPQGGRLIWVVGLVSASVLGFEISLMRVLLVASWHHFAFLVISVVLLGFGASGTALLLARKRVLRWGEPVLFGLAVGTGVTMPVCQAVAQHIPLQAGIVPTLLWEQVLHWTLYWGLLTIPFFLGAAVVGLALMLAAQRMGLLYGSNLIGSAAGAMLAPMAMVLVSPAWLAVLMGGLALAGALGVPAIPRITKLATVTAGLIAVGVSVWVDPPHVRVDSYKRGAQMQLQEAQGSVERVARRFGPRAVVEAYRGSAVILHNGG